MSQFQDKGNQKVSFIKCQRETLESGFEHEIYSNKAYKDPISLLLLSLCIQDTCKRVWMSDWVKGVKVERIRAFDRCATRWVRRATRQRHPYQITCKFIQGANKIAKLPKVGPPTYKLLLVMVKDIMNTCFKDLIVQEKKLYMAVV